MEKIIIGSDIILDVLYDRETRSESAVKILLLCENRLLEGVLTAPALGNVYYSLRKNADHAKIGEKLSLLLTFLEVSSASSRDFIEALNADVGDLESAVNSLAAENIYGISAIVTGNTPAYKNIKASVKTSEEFLTDYFGKI